MSGLLADVAGPVERLVATVHVTPYDVFKMANELRTHLVPSHSFKTKRKNVAPLKRNMTVYFCHWQEN